MKVWLVKSGFCSTILNLPIDGLAESPRDWVFFLGEIHSFLREYIPGFSGFLLLFVPERGLLHILKLRHFWLHRGTLVDVGLWHVAWQGATQGIF